MTAPAQRRRARGRLVVLGLYALVALVAPLLHHDFACHLQSKVHCDACTATSGAPRMESGVALFGHVGSLRPTVPENVVTKAGAERPSSPGRAPPKNLLSV